MKFGVLQFFSWPQRNIPLQSIYARAMDRIQIMDQTGYDAIWLAEHHFSGYSVCPSVHMMATHIAAQTQNIRIGTAISLAAFYHPLRLAEEVAFLDVLSGGRVNWGAGRGFDRVEFDAFGVPQDESYPRFREAVDIVLNAWRNERLTYEGQFHSFHDVEVLPKPLQQPHPPVWIASSSAEAVTWSAEQGHSILMDPHSPHKEIGLKKTHYNEEMAKGGYSVEGRDIPIARLLAVGKTEDEARSIASRGAEWMFQSYMNPRLRNALSDLRSYESREEDRVPPTTESYLKDVIIYGTPESVTDQLHQLHEEIGLDYLLCAPLSHETFNHFTERVLPNFQ